MKSSNKFLKWLQEDVQDIVKPDIINTFCDKIKKSGCCDLIIIK
jgi:hypothetical protein